jgi:predicted esterase
VGLKHYQLFDGIICLSGPGLSAPLMNPFAKSFDPDWLKEEIILNAKKLRVFITHGKEDRAVNYELGIKSRDVLREHGYDVTFHDFEGGHSFPSENILKEIAGWIKEPNQRHYGQQ